MLTPSKTTAEDRSAAIRKKYRQGQKEKAKAAQERANHTAKLRAQRLAKEAADKEASDKKAPNKKPSSEKDKKEPSLPEVHRTPM